VVLADVHSKDLKDFQRVKTLNGDEVTIAKRDGAVYVNHAKVTTADVDATNGVVHIIDRVLIPHQATGAVVVKGIPTQNIVELAVATPDLSTLVAALKAGNLTAALSGAGPFTVFAPTNEAFALLPSGTVAHLLDPRNVKELDAILTYHVVLADVHSNDLDEHQFVKTLNGDEVAIIKRDGAVYVNQAKVTTADVDATNGVVHIIDRVLLPNEETGAVVVKAAPTNSILDLIGSGDETQELAYLLGAANLTDYLSGAGPFTVFAPIDHAFDLLPNGTLKHLLDPRNRDELADILENHVVPGDVHSKDLEEFQRVRTLEGTVAIVKRDGAVYVNGAKVITADVDATNGVVHIIDRVLTEIPH
jgi:uncharacterized surface protein with fasciclin (FAS1) repeats